MFDLSFYKLIKWALNLEGDTKELFHNITIARRRTNEMIKDFAFSLLVMRLTKKEDTNLSNIDRYMDNYFKYFMK